MKILLLNDTSSQTNWGCQATTFGIKSYLTNRYKDVEIIPLHLKPIPFKKIKILRYLLELKVLNCIKEDCPKEKIEKLLKKLNVKIDEKFFDVDMFYLNGEGDIHYKSGHLVRLLGVAYLFKKAGVKSASINQSIDVRDNKVASTMVREVYSKLDLVTVREKYSFKVLQNLNILNAKIVPDAVFNIPKQSNALISKNISTLDLPKEYICITASSILKKKSFSEISNLIEALQKFYSLPILFLASTKTDLSLANYVMKRYQDIKIIDYKIPYEQIFSIIANAKLLAGGRFHPLIFATIQNTPILPFIGNTHKVDGLMELLSYPIKAQSFNSKEEILKAIYQLEQRREEIVKLLEVKAKELKRKISF